MLSLFRSPLRNAVITSFRKTIPFFAKMSTSSNSKPNRLIHEKSPYLLQHAYNPVDWHPWNVEAFTKAKELNRPIFLSVGYSTCHWCHVMEHESFENEELAKIMNENFINIKVDREERPDVDKLYMSFVQAMTGGGGWPMSVFLTPDLKPITGGTYFPPVDQYGRPGFGTILTMISNQWKKNEAKVKDQGVALADAIKEGLKPKKSNAPSAEFVLNSSSGHLVETFDEARGGFGGAPKFPKPVDLDFLLYYYTQDKKSEKGIYALQMVEKTLQAMAMGGIHDHVGKGFHRYSVDANWHVPHFEKMLYDQGQLLYVYANFYKLTGKFKEIVEDIADYVKENLTHPEGGFYSAEDADSLPTHDSTKKREGAFCVWTKEEIDELLEDRPCRYNENVTLAELFETYYEVGENGNVPPYTDPHDELKNQNVLIAKVEHGKRATEFKMSPEKLSVCLEDAKKILRERRALRPKPHLDSKCLTSWNALMISGYASAATAIPERKEFLESAERAIAFICKYLVDDSGALLRSVYTGDNKEVVQIKEPIRGFADDYVFLIQALLDLYEVNFDESLLQWALELQARLDELFWDTEHQSGYYMSRKDDASIFARMQEDQDGAEPATNSVASLNLVRMADLFDIPDYRKKAAEIFAGAGARLQKYPYILNKMLIGVNRFAKSPQQIIVVGSGKDEVVQEFLSLIKKKYLPDKTLAFVDLDTRETSFLLEKNKHLKELMSAVQKPTVFICENFACGLPISSVDELGKRLETL